REDLHLDSRIMQSLEMINRLLARDFAKAGPENGGVRGSTRICTYPVIPLSNKSGLIRWVENMLPLADIYKAWQNRQPQIGHGARPIQQYMQKVNQCLSERGLPTSTPRKDWPPDMLRRVFLELCAD